MIGWGNERLPYEGLLQKLPRFFHLYSLFPFSGKNTSRLAINYHFSGKYAFPGPISLCREPNNPSFATELPSARVTMQVNAHPPWTFVTRQQSSKVIAAGQPHALLVQFRVKRFPCLLLPGSQMGQVPLSPWPARKPTRRREQRKGKPCTSWESLCYTSVRNGIFYVFFLTFRCIQHVSCEIRAPPRSVAQRR